MARTKKLTKEELRELEQQLLLLEQQKQQAEIRARKIRRIIELETNQFLFGK